MKYEKPKVVGCGPASVAIQGTEKNGQPLEIGQRQTNTAYEADE